MSVEKNYWKNQTVFLCCVTLNSIRMVCTLKFPSFGPFNNGEEYFENHLHFFQCYWSCRYGECAIYILLKIVHVKETLGCYHIFKHSLPLCMVLPVPIKLLARFLSISYTPTLSWGQFTPWHICLPGILFSHS